MTESEFEELQKRKRETGDLFELFTIGYEGRNTDEFISELKKHDIIRLIDIRENPFSRKKGYSKSALKNSLECQGIEYIHLKALGTPLVIRNKLKEDKDHDYFIKAYQDYLLSNMEAVKEAYGYITNKTSCLMCYERLPENCHRSLAAKIIKDYDGKDLIIKHI